MDFSVLKQVGVNSDSAIERFMGNESLYVRMLKKFLDDKTFACLVESVSAKDGKTALESSHTLKGICGNLSIDCLYTLFSEQVTLMRADKWEEAYAMMDEITENHSKVTGAVKELIDNQ